MEHAIDNKEIGFIVFSKLRPVPHISFKNLARNTARNTARFWPARSNFCTNCHEVDPVKARNTGMTRIRPESGQNLVYVRNGPKPPAGSFALTSVTLGIRCQLAYFDIS